VGNRPNWTEEEITYLEERWGRIKTATIAKKLNRTIMAVKQKAIKRGLGPALRSSDYMTIYDISIAFNKNYSSIMQIWVANNGLQFEERAFVEKMKYKVIKPKDFWTWANQNKGLINFAKYERYALPEEPDWLLDKIKSDYSAQDFSRVSRVWTKADDGDLKYMYASGKFTLAQMSQKLNRSETAIKRRAYDLGFEKNFIRSKNQLYTQDELNKLLELANRSLCLKAIAKAMDRSENSVRSKLERMGYNFKTCTFGEIPACIKNRKLRRQQKKLQEAR
jgi:hypothetical protein